MDAIGRTAPGAHYFLTESTRPHGDDVCIFMTCAYRILFPLVLRTHGCVPILFFITKSQNYEASDSGIRERVLKELT